MLGPPGGRTREPVGWALAALKRGHHEGANAQSASPRVEDARNGLWVDVNEAEPGDDPYPLTGAVIRASKTTAVRYEHDHPGSLAHMDVKKVGRIHDGGGWKAHGRGHGQTGARKRAKIGFDYIHSLIDDHSRLAYSEVLADEKGATCAGFLLRAAAYFATYGITRIERVMTDNHFSYKLSADVAAAMTAPGARCDAQARGSRSCDDTV